MRVRLCGQEDTREIEESLGRRLCEQGKAVAVPAQGDTGHFVDRGIATAVCALPRNDIDASERAEDRGIVPQRESPGAGQTGAEQCGPDHTVDISEITEKAARKRGKRNGAGGEDKDGQ